VQVLVSMCVIELAKKGQEASTYELIVSINNVTLGIAGIFATQFLVVR